MSILVQKTPNQLLILLLKSIRQGENRIDSPDRFLVEKTHGRHLTISKSLVQDPVQAEQRTSGGQSAAFLSASQMSADLVDPPAWAPGCTSCSDLSFVLLRELAI